MIFQSLNSRSHPCINLGGTGVFIGVTETGLYHEVNFIGKTYKGISVRWDLEHKALARYCGYFYMYFHSEPRVHRDSRRDA